MIFSRMLSRLTFPVTSVCMGEIHTSASVEAARKGTRLRREAIKKAMKRKKIEVAKKEFIPMNKRKELEKLKKLQAQKLPEEEPTDNVYVVHLFKEKVFSLTDAISNHRQFFHPTSFNQPDSLVNAYIELSMKIDKKNRYIPAFSGMLNIPYQFDAEEDPRNLLVISADPNIASDVQSLGVSVVGPDVGRLIKTNRVNLDEYSHILCDVQVLPDLTGLRPIMKKKFPAVAEGTAVVDIASAVKKFMNGLEYTVVKNKYDPNLASIDAKIGRLSMSDHELEANLNLLMKDISAKQPKTRAKSMIDQVQLRCYPSVEKPKIEYEKYLIAAA